MIYGVERSNATSIKYLSFKDLVLNASEIVCAEVIERHSYWSEKQQGIWSLTTIRPYETIEGKIKIHQDVKVRQRGGVLADRNIAQKAVGSVELIPGEKIILFLKPINKDMYRLVGMCQGVFRITGENGKKIVYRPRTKAQLVKTIPPTESDRKIFEDFIPLDQFVCEITKILEMERDG